MDFYFRNNELDELLLLNKQSSQRGRMSALLGRRRLGKTTLALQSVKDRDFVYLFVAKKAEILLCQSFVEEIQSKLSVTIHGELTGFKSVFAYLLELSKTRPITVIVDEFQEFFKINPSVYSDLQALWDLNKDDAQMHVIFIGSVYSMMDKIFESQHEPLFGRTDRIIQLRPFSITNIKGIMQDYHIDDLQSLFDFYVVSGGVPKYLDLLLENGCTDLESIIKFMVRENSPFLNEGRNQLIEEFGKDYAIYFSILELIARGKTASSDIESVIQTKVTAYLDRLEADYKIIKKIKPINAKPNSKTQKYQIIDHFLRFWFRFLHRYRDALEIDNYEFVRRIIQRDYTSYSGRVMELFFFDLLASTEQFNRLGSYWRRDGKDEIDIVGINDIDKTITFAEVKIAARRHSLARLEQRAAGLLSQFPDYRPEYLCLTLADASNYLQSEDA